jgi:hypothetical protein
MKEKYLILLLFFVCELSNSTAQIKNLTEGSEIETITGESVRLSQAQLDDFGAQTRHQLDFLSKYIKIIADKSEATNDKLDAINLAVGLFRDEKSIVEASSLNKATKRYVIREYLHKIRQLPYYKVDIEWFDIFFTSDFTLRPDGKYEGIATIYQKFEARNKEGNYNYVDITKKNIQVIVERIDVSSGNKIEKEWRVKFGNIKVAETKTK